MNAPHDPRRDAKLVELARRLERLGAKRRRMLKQFEELSDEIQLTRSLIRQLTTPEPRSVPELGELPELDAAAGVPPADAKSC